MAGGGGSDDQPLQYRRSMIQGSSHPRTARRAIGQDTGGRIPFPSLIFFPVAAASAGTSGRTSGSDGFCGSSVVLQEGWLT